MGPSVRELAQRIVDGERMKPENVRAVVLVLSEAYESVRAAACDGVYRRLDRSIEWVDVVRHIADAVTTSESMLTEDLRDARIAIGCATHLCTPGNLRA